METPIKISIVIPAFNEQKLLPRLLQTIEFAIQKSEVQDNQIEVIVADNFSTDSTVEIAKEAGCTIIQNKIRRIGAVRNTGAGIAKGELILFVDADMQIHENTISAIYKLMQSKEFVGGGSGLKMERNSFPIFLSNLFSLPMPYFWGLESGVWFCRRSDFESIGGYDESRLAGEDFEFLVRLRRHGRTCSPNQPLATRRDFQRKLGLDIRAINSCRKFDEHGDWHLFWAVPLGFFYSLFSKERFKKFAEEYWYRR